MSFVRKILFASCLALVGCTGLIGSDDAGDLDPNRPNPDAQSCDGVCVGRSGMMRLTRVEYRHAVEAVFGTAAAVDVDRLPFDAKAGPFSANDTELTEPDVGDYNAAAWAIAARLANDLAAECDAATCVDHLLDTYGAALFRRPISEADRAGYHGLFEWSVSEDSLEASVELMVATMLQSPDFIYRVEPAEDGAAPTVLDGFAVATRLSLFLWREGPDATLREAALAGELDTVEGVERHARRMLADERAERAIADFHREWLALGELDGEPQLAEAMRRETESFAVDVFRHQEGRLSALLTGDRASVTEPLAAHYGVSPGEDVAVPGHVGILTHASVMSRYTSASYTRPVRRGDMLLSQVLCRELGTTPPDALEQAENESAELPADMSDRDKLDTITSGDACTGCHQVINPAGFVFEAYDQAGRYRTVDTSGRTIDASGTFDGFGDMDGDFDGPATLMPRLAESEALAACLSEQWMRFGLARMVADDDAVTVERVQRVLSETGDLREVIIAITKSDAFRYRWPRQR